MRWILALALGVGVMFAQADAGFENQECHQVEECE